MVVSKNGGAEAPGSDRSEFGQHAHRTLVDARTLAKVGVVEAQHADPLSLIHFQKVLILKSAVAQIEEMLK